MTSSRSPSPNRSGSCRRFHSSRAARRRSRSPLSTVPSKVAVSVAPSSACSALVSESCAVCTFDSLAAICALEAPDDSSSSSAASASARSDCGLVDAGLETRGIDRCEDLTRGDLVAGTHVDRGDFAGGTEAQVVGLGHGDGTFGRDRLGQRASRDRDELLRRPRRDRCTAVVTADQQPDGNTCQAPTTTAPAANTRGRRRNHERLPDPSDVGVFALMGRHTRIHH